MNDADLKFSARALELAAKARGITSPDPLVGAVVVNNGRIVGEGYHKQVCTPHAETVAIKNAGSKAAGATLYVNLEPCNHFGNNPPCTDLIIRSGIKKVIASMKDPNPLVAGKGFAKLKKHGIHVVVGIRGHEAKALNEHFSKFITKKLPFVILKSAMSLDGKIATRTGESRWISSEASRKYVHELRASVDAVMTSIKTVVTDDPTLNVRMAKGRDPLKVIIDPKCETPLKSKVITHSPQRTIIVASKTAAASKVTKLTQAGAEVIFIPSSSGIIDLMALMKVLAKKNIMSVMIEAGGGLAASALDARIVDKLIYFIAPKVIGGSSSPTPVGGEGVRRISRALHLKNMKFSELGPDIVIQAYLS